MLGMESVRRFKALTGPDGFTGAQQVCQRWAQLCARALAAVYQTLSQAAKMWRHRKPGEVRGHLRGNRPACAHVTFSSNSQLCC